MTRYMVTGAAGFIGSSLCAGLVAEGHEVVGFDDLSDGTLENLSGTPEVRFVEGDVRDQDAVTAAATGCSVIFHQAAMRSVPRSMVIPGPTTDVNVRGTMNILAAAADAGARVVAASSSSVYGNQKQLPLREDMDLLPRSPYAASKAAGEIYCASWWRAFGVPAVSLRYFNVYGPRQDPASEYAAVVPRFIVACLNGERAIVHSDGEQSRDFTYIDDVISANMLAARAPEDAFGRAFNIGGGAPEPTTINEVLRSVAELCGVDADPVHEAARPGDVRTTRADVSLARHLLGYAPAVSVEEGLRRTVASFSAQGS